MLCLQVVVTHGGPRARQYKVKDLLPGANSLMFTNEREGKDMSVEAYFLERYKKQ